MQNFIVNDMSCGHCVAALHKAFQQAMPEAKVEIDLARHTVSVDGNGAAAAAVIREAGYTPEPV